MNPKTPSSKEIVDFATRDYCELASSMDKALPAVSTVHQLVAAANCRPPSPGGTIGGMRWANQNATAVIHLPPLHMPTLIYSHMGLSENVVHPIVPNG